MEEFVPAPPPVVPYDRAWATSYKKEARLLGIALAPVPHWVEHIGSTAVPGLPAKPVIDPVSYTHLTLPTILRV